MTAYIWRGDRFVDKRTGEPMETRHEGISMPAMRSDIAAYKSPLGTGLIEGRAAQREDLARNGCRLADRSEFRDFPTGGSYENRRFVEKHRVATDRPRALRLNTDRAKGGRYAD